ARRPRSKACSSTRPPTTTTRRFASTSACSRRPASGRSTACGATGSGGSSRPSGEGGGLAARPRGGVVAFSFRMLVNDAPARRGTGLSPRHPVQEKELRFNQRTGAPELSVSMALGYPRKGLTPVRHCTRRSPTRTPPPPNPTVYRPMDHLLFGATFRGGTQPSQSLGPPEPPEPRADRSARANEPRYSVERSPMSNVSVR